jgi:hypothetical protein
VGTVLARPRLAKGVLPYPGCRLSAAETARWLLVEWRPGGIIRSAFSNIPADARIEQAVSWWKERWQVEQGYRPAQIRTRTRALRGAKLERVPSPCCHDISGPWIPRARAPPMAAPLETAEPLRGAWRDGRACPPCAAPFSSSSLHPCRLPCWSCQRHLLEVIPDKAVLGRLDKTNWTTKQPNLEFFCEPFY